MLESLKREKSQRRCTWSQVERQLGNTLTRTLNTTGAQCVLREQAQHASPF